MIPSNIGKEHVIDALREIESEGVSASRRSKSFCLIVNGKKYPPKYVVSLANKYANGEELDPSSFSGGRETNGFLKKLGFDIVQIPSSGKADQSTPSRKKIFETVRKKHDERCPKCKNTIQRMLKECYGRVESNYKFEASTNVNDYKDFRFYKELKRIFIALQRCRGHKGFVRTPNLPRCDFFVPNPGFILEFDESQHFTVPRKISLQNYPKELRLGFSAKQWIAHCEEINAKDNDPIFRDEQRAWYDTLRDFLPSCLGLNPTVRLYSKEMQWCRLNPKNPKDLALFKNIVERKRIMFKNWIATVLIQSNENYTNRDRLKILSQIVDRISKRKGGNGVILFPGGWFTAGKRRANTLYKWVEQNVGLILSGKHANIIACVGIDGRETSGWAKDQIGAAINRKGIIALGRKFHPAPSEKMYVELARNYLSKEEGYSRIFEVNGQKYFICACYDSFGLKHKKIPNPGIDVVLDLVHGFYPKGESGSGDVYFAKHGFAGASKHWKCLVFGAAVFFNRRISEKWPSGVYWNQGDSSTQTWRYEDNPAKPKEELELKIKEGFALVRIYKH